MHIRNVLKLLEESFPGISANIMRRETLGFSWSKTFLKEENGEILSHVAFMDYPIVIQGDVHNVGALHAICTKQAFRGRGFASELIQEALKDARSAMNMSCCSQKSLGSMKTSPFS